MSLASSDSQSPARRMTVRDALFPIYGREIQKFAILGAIKFLIIFVLTLTRDLKDSLVVTSCGAEAITFLKVYGVLPASTLFILGYSRVANWLPRSTLWEATAVPFFVFFALFDLVLYPMRERLHPQGALGLPQGLEYAASLYQHWTFALFYVMAELYSSVAISILFWQFANDVVPIKLSARFYPLFGQVSSLAPVLAGEYVKHYAASDGVDMGGSIHRVTLAACACGAGMLALHRWYLAILDREAREAAPSAEATTTSKSSKAGKKKLGMGESIRFLASSPYLGYLAVMVLSYGLSIQFTDILWKSTVRRLHPDTKSMQRYFAKFSSRVGATTFVVIFFGSNIVKTLGWRVGALMTPSAMAALAGPFFWLLLSAPQDLSHAGLTTIVQIGAVQSMVSKATKYALFDPTTQMAYIPLDEESKVKGKAAIDVLGSRFGKSGGALLQQALVMHFGTIAQAAPAVAGLFFTVIACWVTAASRLAPMFRLLSEQHQKKQQ